MSLDDWYRFLKNWKRNEERRKEQRAKERLRLREERLRLERQKEERLKKEQQLREKKHKQKEERLKIEEGRIDGIRQVNQQQNNTNFWVSNSLNNSSSKIYVEGYRRKDGTEVKGYWRDK
ncbi:MAG: hypothetical protein V7L25_17090 [Nostoc sp.]|uniref:hypothetical protein n=1 Tax=Nostoc sp. TaxID=1180 RepID=UPI002FF2EAF2